MMLRTCIEIRKFCSTGCIMCHPSETVFVTCLKKFYALWATEALMARCWVTMTKSTWQALNPSFWLQVYALKNIVDLSTPTPGARRRHSSNRLVICTLRRAMLQHEVVPKMNYLTIWYYLYLYVLNLATFDLGFPVVACCGWSSMIHLVGSLSTASAFAWSKSLRILASWKPAASEWLTRPWSELSWHRDK